MTLLEGRSVSSPELLDRCICVLGCSGAIAQDCHTTSFLAGKRLLVDAGTGLGRLSLDQMSLIQDVVLTHCHLDHVAALPLMLDAVGTRRGQPLRVHGLTETLTALQTHVFNGVMWPDFSRLPSAAHPFLTFHPLSVGDVLDLSGWRVEVMPANHTVPAVGYALARNEHGPWWVFSGDTGIHPPFWARLNQLDVQALVVETAFSQKEATLAEISRHLSPASLSEALALMSPEASYPIYITHTKPAEAQMIMTDIQTLTLSGAHRGKRRHLQLLAADHMFEV